MTHIQDIEAMNFTLGLVCLLTMIGEVRTQEGERAVDGYRFALLWCFCSYRLIGLSAYRLIGSYRLLAPIIGSTFRLQTISAYRPIGSYRLLAPIIGSTLRLQTISAYRLIGSYRLLSAPSK